MCAFKEASMSQENMTVIRGMYESFSKGDVISVLGQMHQHIEWREAENNVYMTGPATEVFSGEWSER